MTAPDFGNLINKVKTATKQAADQTGKLAKIAKLKATTLSLHSEKNRHLSTIGLRTYVLFAQENSEDGPALKERVKEEIAQIQRIEKRVAELNSEIAELQTNATHVDVTDVTEK